MFDDLRSAWGAAPATNPKPMDLTKVTKFVNHWDGDGIAVGAHTTCLSYVRAIQRYHQETRGWSDIGYSGLICPHGRAIEGRGDNVGAHTAGLNDTAYGWCFLAGPTHQPTPEAYSRMVDAKKACEDHVNRVLAPSCHRDHASTECPGDEVYAWVQAGMIDPLQEDGMDNETAARLIASVDALTKTIKDLQSTEQSRNDTLVGKLQDLATATNMLAGKVETAPGDTAQLVADGLTGVVEPAVAQALSRVRVTLDFAKEQ